MKKTISLLLALLLCIGLTSPAHASAAPFADVPSSHWAYKEIMEAYKDGAVQGTAANAYNPNGNVTMAQFIAILTRAFYPEQVEASTASGAWYAPYYEVAEWWGLLNDFQDQSPDTEVTREAMAQIMFILLLGTNDDGVVGVKIPNQQERQAAEKRIPDFEDVSWVMHDAVATCYSLGVITGVDSSGRFSPQGRMNRAQTAVIYVRLKQAMETGTGIAPSQTQTGTSAGTSGATLTNGKPVTEENVLALIEEYKNGKAPGTKAQEHGFTSYAPRSTYDAYKPKYYLAPFGSGIECAKFAFAFWDELFGDLPMRKFTNPENIRPGDLLEEGGHWSIAVTSPFIDSFGELAVWTVDGTGTSSGSGSVPIAWSTVPTWIGNDRIVAAYTRYPD